MESLNYEEIKEQEDKIFFMTRLFNIRNNKRTNILLHVFLCFFCQIVLVVSIAIYLYKVSNFQSEVGVSVMFCRFICGSILHLSLLDEVTKGLNNMKFALNHTYMFDNFALACFTSSLQALIVIAVELVNIEIILVSLNPLDIVYNFIALAIIAEFDDFVFAALRNEPMKMLIKKAEKILIVKHTSSKKCKDWQLSDVDYEDEQGANKGKRPLRQNFGQRSCGNKCFYVQYKCLRSFYVSVYFYFLPFATIMLSCLIPIVAQLDSGRNE